MKTAIVRRTWLRLIVFIIVFIIFWPNQNVLTIIETPSQSTFVSGTGIEIPLSSACTLSRQAVAAQNITSAPPNGSRIDGLSLLASEIKSIQHIPMKREVVINLVSPIYGRICERPFVMGRLSGQSVTLINKWKPIINMDEKSPSKVVSLVGEYTVPTPGRYFLEIIGLLCNDLRWDKEYKDVCLEDPNYMRITDDLFAYIDVDNVLPAQMNVGNTKSGLASGHWKWSNNESQPDEYPGLLTRYQPPGCRGAAVDEQCTSAMSLDRFAHFDFLQQHETVQVKAHALTANTSNNLVKLCFVGLSHSREMAKAVNMWLQRWNASNVVVQNFDAQFPRIVNEDFIQKIIIGKQCNKTVIACGQWSAGRKPPGSKYRNLPPTPFPEYREEVRDMILSLQATGAKDVFLRSIHYNSLGDLKLTCPPQDWRHPAVIDRYNIIIKNLTQSMNIPFIDTSHIIGPMWDTAGDFCHYRNDEVSSSEALHVLERLLSDQFE